MGLGVGVEVGVGDGVAVGVAVKVGVRVGVSEGTGVPPRGRRGILHAEANSAITAKSIVIPALLIAP